MAFCSFNSINRISNNNKKSSIVYTLPTPLYYYKFNTVDLANGNALANYATGSAVYDGSVNAASINTTTKKGGTGSMFFNNGSLGNTTSFNGGYYWVRCPSWISPATITGLSISLWFYSSTVSGRDFSGMVSVGNAGSDYIIIGLLNGVVWFGNKGADYSTGPTLVANTWYHVVYTISTTGVQTGYVNNIAYSISGATAGKTVILNHTYVVALGFNNVGSCIYYLGFLDDLRIFSTELSAGQVALLYNNPT